MTDKGRFLLASELNQWLLKMQIQGIFFAYLNGNFCLLSWVDHSENMIAFSKKHFGFSFLTLIFFGNT